MLLAIDIGNTNITLGVFKEEKLEFTARLNSDKSMTADQYAVLLERLIALHGLDSRDISAAVVGSVVPVIGGAVSAAIKLLFGFDAMVLGPGVKTGINIRIDNPAQLGADLVAGAVGASAKYPLPVIIADLGTATTFSVIDKKGNFLGGTIGAGIRTSLDALATNTAQLPYIELEAPDSVIGTNTADSMKSGLILGAAAMLDGMAQRIEEELGDTATLVATGGMASAVTRYCKKEFILDNDLLLDGLRIIFNKNNK